jgi:hypothetical protein
MTEGALDGVTTVDRRDYAAIAPPVTSAQVVKCLAAGGAKLGGGVLVGAAGENVGRSDPGWTETVAPAAAT